VEALAALHEHMQASGKALLLSGVHTEIMRMNLTKAVRLI